MAKLGQFADVHDSFADLLRTLDRRTLVEWIGEAASLSLGDIGEIHERSPTIAVLGFLRPARKGVADVILTVFDHHGRRLASLILEVQLSLDWSKRWTWPMLETTLAAETHTEARVVVFSPDPLERAAIRRLLLPKMQPQPLLIEPDQIRLIDDAAEARRRPRETIFAALYHARETQESLEARVAAIRAAVLAVRTLDYFEQLKYGDLMYSFTPSQIMQRVLEELRESGRFEEPAPRKPKLYRDSYAYVQGEQDGREAGREEARAAHRDMLRRLIVDLLEARGTPVASQLRTQIEQCTDADQLARWCSKAAAWTGPAEALFDDSER